MIDKTTLLPEAESSEGFTAEALLGKSQSALREAVRRHRGFECASFHTPGHKGRVEEINPACLTDLSWYADLTELPGLDDLSCPQGVLASLEERAALLFGARQSIISVNGASACLAATFMALSERGTSVLVPRNAHRSIIHGLILSGLFPIWYEPVWDDVWGLWGAVSAVTVERLLERYGESLAGLVLVSPTYAGALSDVAAVSSICRNHDIPLVVDEAHGAHFLPDTTMPESALSAGADVVVHSLHKTLTALTQTGLLHVGPDSLLDADRLRAGLGLLQSSSPSYLLLSSIEQCIDFAGSRLGRMRLESLQTARRELEDFITSLADFRIYQPLSGVDPLHVVIGTSKVEPARLSEFLCRLGIFPETVVGNGVLFLLGLGTQASDVSVLQSALRQFPDEIEKEEDTGVFGSLSRPCVRPPEITQILAPRQAATMPSEAVPVHQAVGRIAADLIAPCPPGVPVLVPGQRVPPEVLDSFSLPRFRVVIE